MHMNDFHDIGGFNPLTELREEYICTVLAHFNTNTEHSFKNISENQRKIF